MNGRPWTVDEEEYLRKHYKKQTLSEIGRVLGRTFSSVGGRARILKLPAYKAQWTPREDRFVKNLWGEFTLATIARRLKRNRSAVSWRARELGLRAMPEGTESLRQAAKRAGISINVMRRLLANAPTVSMGPEGKWRAFDKFTVTEIVEQYLSKAPALQYAKEAGVSEQTLRAWLLAAEKAGLVQLPARLGRRKHWRLEEETVKRALAWRASLVSVQSLARERKLLSRTVRLKLEALGVPVILYGRAWYVDRKAAEAALR